MPAKLKMRSVSVEDLGHIVKQMIDGVLEDSDQVAKLRQAVFQEYYFRKMEELKQVKAKIDAGCILDQKEKLSQIDTSESHISEKPYSLQIGDTKAGDNETIDNSLAGESESHELSVPKFTECHQVNCLSPESINMNSSRSGPTVNSVEKGDEKAAKTLVMDQLEPPVMHVIRRRQKYVRIPEQTDLQVATIHSSNICLGLANHHTTTDLTQNLNHATKSEENAQTPAKNVFSNLEITEWRSGTFGKETLGQNSRQGNTREIKVQFKSRGEIAFENWKKEKTNIYNRIFREDKKRRGIEQADKAKKIEKKEAANEAYLYWRRQQDARQKLINNRKRIVAQMESQKVKSREKSRENSQAFKVWKRQKDVKLRERRMYMMAYSEQSNLQRQSKPQNPKPGVHIAFNTWLDQLDCVLHQKYLRERRYLVRSFYCQPAYFGSAALRAR